MQKRILQLSTFLLITLTLNSVHAKFVVDFDLCSHECLNMKDRQERSTCCTTCGQKYLKKTEFAPALKEDKIQQCIVNIK